MGNPWRHIMRLEPWLRLAAWVAFALGLWALLLLTGCTRLRTVTIPAEPSSVNVETDTTTLAEYPPVGLKGQATLPETRTLIGDTASRPTISVSRVEVDNRPDESAVRVLWRRGEGTVRDEYELPVYGEMLVWTPQTVNHRGYPVRTTNRPRDTPDTVEVQPTAEVVGEPTEQVVEADVTTSEPAWYRTLWTWVRMAFAFGLGAALSYVVVKLVPGL